MFIKKLFKKSAGIIAAPYYKAAIAAPFALDGTPQAKNSGASSALALDPFSTTYGNDLIFVSLITNGGPGLAPTGGGLTFTLRTRTNDGTGTDNNELWYAVAASPLSSVVITVNTTTASFVTGCVFAFSGGNTSSPFDANGAIPATNNSGSPNYFTFTTSNADDILIANGRTGGSVTADTGFTLITGSNFLGVQYQLVSATQSGVTANWGTGVSGGGNASDAIVKGP